MLHRMDFYDYEKEGMVMVHRAELFEPTKGWKVYDDIQPIVDTLYRGDCAFYQSNSPRFEGRVFRITPDKLTMINEFLKSETIFTVGYFWSRFGEAYEDRFDAITGDWWN